MDDFDIPDILPNAEEEKPMMDDVEEEDVNDEEYPEEQYHYTGPEEFPTFEVTFDQLGHTSAIGGAGGQQSRYFDILRRINATESENFLEQMSIFYSNHDLPFDQQNNIYSKLLVNYPHPRFLNIPLCFIARNYFYDQTQKKCRWTQPYLSILKDDIEKNKSLEVLLPIVENQHHDIYRYILLMNQFSF